MIHSIMVIEYTYLEEIQEDNKQTHLLNKWKQIQSKQRHSQGHHNEFEPGKAQYSCTIFLTGCFLKEHIETQNLGKARALEALVAVVALLI